MICVLSDIHANLPALEAVWAWIQENVKDPEIVSLGDQVGYGPFPQETLDLLDRIGEEIPVSLMMGNHESGVFGFENLRYWNFDAIRVLQWTRDQIKDDSLLRGLGPSLNRGDLRFVHGDFLTDHHFDYIIFNDDAYYNLSESDGFRVGFFGHTHFAALFGILPNQPGLLKKGKAKGTHDLNQYLKVLVNPGSVGQPRDEDPRSSFCTYDPTSGELTFVRVEYDIDRTAQAIREAGLPETLATRLYKGY